jgi:DNA primase
VPAKYLNSPETPLFIKSKEMYGIDTAKKIIRKYDFACVVEGQVDLVMAQQVFPNTVATSGTALTDKHIQLIKRFTDRVVFVFDSDNAGVNAAFKATLVALKHDMEVKITQLPEGKDPADIIIENKEEYKEYISSSKLAFDFFTEYIVSKTSGREQTKQIEEKLLTLLRAVSNPLERDRYINHIASKLSITPDAIHAKLSATPDKKPTQQNNKTQEEAEKPQKLIERYSELVQWQQKNGKDISGYMDVFEPELQKMIKSALTSVTIDETRIFKLENEFETDILLTNEISELQTRIIVRYKEFKFKSLQEKLEQAKREGNKEHIQTLLQSIQSLITS